MTRGRSGNSYFYAAALALLVSWQEFKQLIDDGHKFPGKLWKKFTESSNSGMGDAFLGLYRSLYLQNLLYAIL